MRYTALIDGSDGAFGVTFPDLPGCTAMGASVDEALTSAASALRVWAEAFVAGGNEMPQPTGVDALRKDPDVREALAEGAALASVVLVAGLGRPVKANMSLDSGVLADIDDAAKRLGLTRSGMVERLASDGLRAYA